MSAHTPGPWRAVWTGRTGGGDIRPENRHYTVVATAPAIPGFIGERDVPVCDMTSLSSEANGPNARLIAAAPELLEACRLIVSYDEADNTDSVVFMLAYADALAAARAAIAKATKP